ncbi:alpha/beta hydrolase [Roseomonas chloroacetimidivorans]|uniref:alpha/beta hydrolase n=1 Tax=Roseomonas chloroacetimidivorans TaxID=1766656 RepID=UPI003C7712EC
MKDDPLKVPLSDVAEDAACLIRAFRENGEISFQNVPVNVSRQNYRNSCRVNGLRSEILSHVADHLCRTSDGGTVSLREYRPAGMSRDAMLPLVLFIHGGGWVLGDLDTHDPVCRALCNGSGAAVFAVDYRRPPEFKFPIPLCDCRDALAWIAVHSRELRVDPRRMAVVGDSAGGNLAAVLANSPPLQPKGSNLKVQALFYPVTDLRGETASYRRLSSGFPLTAGSMDWFRSHYLAGKEDLHDPRLSPLLALERCLAPMFIVTCGLDPLSDEGIDYATTAAHSGGLVEHHHRPAHAHGIFTSAGRIKTGARLLSRAAAFLKEHLDESPHADSLAARTGEGG